MKRSFIQLVTCLAALALFATGSAHAQNNKGGGTTGTTTGPVVIPGGAFATTYVIAAPGSYLLGGNRSTDGSVHVIEIKAPNVTLDLNGFTLSQTNPATKAGVFAGNAQSVEIRNGSIAHAGYGVYAAYDDASNAGSGLRVINLRISDSAGGVASAATATHVERCEMINCPGVGIQLGGIASVATDCMVHSPKGNSIGVLLNGACRLLRTSIYEAKMGIVATGGIVTDCGVTNCDTGVQMSAQTTLRNLDILGNAIGVASGGTDNVVIGCRIALNTANFQGSYTNGGGNFFQ